MLTLREEAMSPEEALKCSMTSQLDFLAVVGRRVVLLAEDWGAMETMLELLAATTEAVVLTRKGWRRLRDRRVLTAGQLVGGWAACGHTPHTRSDTLGRNRGRSDSHGLCQKGIILNIYSLV